MDGLLYYLGILGHYKWLIIIVTLLVTLAVTAFCVVSVSLPPGESPLPNRYAAQATILIQQTAQNDISGTILAALGMNTGFGSGSTFDNSEMVMEILRSRTLLDRLIEEFDLSARYRITSSIKGKTREAVLRHCSFQYSRNTGMLRISFMDIDPVFSRDVVNRQVALLDEWFTRNRVLAKQKQRELLEEKILEVESDIVVLKERVQTLQKKYGVLNAQELGAGLYNVAEEFSLLSSELDLKQRIYNTLSPQYEAAKLAPESEPIFQVFEMAEVPDMKAGPMRSRFVIIAFVGGFIGSSSLALFLSLMKSIRRTRILSQ